MTTSVDYVPPQPALRAFKGGIGLESVRQDYYSVDQLQEAFQAGLLAAAQVAEEKAHYLRHKDVKGYHRQGALFSAEAIMALWRDAKVSV